MFRRAGYKLNIHVRSLSSSSLTHGALTHKCSRIGRYGRGIAVAAVGAVLGGTAAWVYSGNLIHNEAMQLESGKLHKNKKPAGPVSQEKTDPDVLHSLIWGSDNNNVISPGTSGTDSIRVPTVALWLEGVALRDLRLHDTHAASVDARGDVYQWGDGFFGQTSSNPDKKPRRTLRGKNIVQLQLTDDKVYALSASGKVYVLASSADKQVLSHSPSTSWWGRGDAEMVDVVEVTPAVKLGWGESFMSIATGKDHLLALTSKGRVFAHPVNKSANHCGQLGFRKFSIPDPHPRAADKSALLLDVELVPKSQVDPYANASRAIRTTPKLLTSENLANVDDKSIRFCTSLFEIPALRGVDAAQIAAGSRTSFILTKTGRVLAWGANEFGQLGLGSNISLDAVTVPTEVVLWRFVPGHTESRCLDISAGGDLTAFVVERKSPDNGVTIDLLMSGNGQYGGLGNNAYLNSQGEPTRVKGISGLVQYNDRTKSREPIIPTSISISSTGHALVSLNSSTSGIGGNDLMVWGKNYEFELGNGKKASISQPVILEASEGGRLMMKKQQAKEVKDLQGKVWKRGVAVEQRAIAGPQNSVVYWKFV